MKKSFLLLLVLAMLCPIAACSSGSGTAETQAPITEGAPAETNAPETDAETAEPKTNPYENLPATPGEVDALIASIPGAEINFVNDIDRAYYAYCRLSEADRAAVTKIGELQTLRSDLLKRYMVKEYKDARIPHEKFLIGAFPFYRYDDEHIEQLVDAKIDFVLCLSTVHEYSMSQMNKFGIGVIAEMNKIGLPSWIGAFENGTLINPITEEEIRAQIDPDNVTDYPALWGFYISDEPNANEFPYLSTLARVSKEYLPQTAVYCNLFPTYASRAQLGIFNYEAYIGGFVKNIESDINSFDHYYENHDIIDTIKNMQIVSEAAANSGRDFWDFLQIGRSNPDFPEISADMLRYQA